jgi:peptide/nickel transport system substrate-binding protein
MASPLRGAKLPRRAALALLGLAVAAFLWNPGGARSARKDALIVAVAGLPTSFAFDDRPVGYENMEYNNVTSGKLVRSVYVYDGDDGGHQDLSRFEPFLAESYSVSDDGLVYTFHLHQGLLSPAGHELTADDVIWSFERKWRTRGGTPYAWALVMKDPARQLRKIDRYTVSFDIPLKSDGLTLLALLANVTGDIYDSTVLKAHATPSDPYAVTWSGRNGNFGFGAYTLKSFEPGQRMVLAANPHYVFGRPAIGEIIEQVVPDPGMRANLLEHGDVDAATQLRPADMSDLEHSADIRTYRMRTNNVVAFTMKGDAPPFNDMVVRRAFQYALPYQKIVDDVYKGRAEIRRGIINPVYMSYAEPLPPRVYDPAKAREMLLAAGYHLPVEFTVTINSTVPDLREAFLQIQTNAAPAGFKVLASLVPPAGLTSALHSGKFQSYMTRDMAVTQTPPYELLNLLKKGSPNNHSLWSNDEFYRLIDAGRAEPDPLSPDAAHYWREAQMIWRNEVPYITIVSVAPLVGLRRDIVGFANRTDNTIDYSILSRR